MLKTVEPKYLSLTYFIGTFFLLFSMLLVHMTAAPNSLYEKEYWMLFGTLVIVLLAYYAFLKAQPFEQFSPAHIFILFFIFIFWVTPCILIDFHLTLCHGFNVMGGCFWGTFNALFGILAFMLGYYMTKSRTIKLQVSDTTSIRKRALRISYIIFGLCFAIQMYAFMKLNGYTVSYVLSFASDYNGIDSSYEQDKSMLFIGYTTKMMMLPWLVIVTISRKWWDRLLFTWFLFSVYYVMGARYIFYLAILSFIIVHYRQINKKLQLKMVLILLAVLLVFSAFVQKERSNVRTGKELSSFTIEKEDIQSTLQSNFEIYQPFYGVVDKVPDKHDFTYGQAVFTDPLVMWLPRFMFPGKPEPRDFAYAKAIRASINDYVIDVCGIAMPIIGDFYVDFGLFGVVIGSFVLGLLYKKSIKLYYGSNYFGIIAFAIICSATIQVVNRGFIPSLVPLHVFLLLPLVFYYKLYKYDRK